MRVSRNCNYFVKDTSTFGSCSVNVVTTSSFDHLLPGLLLLDRYTREITELAAVCVGQGSVDNRSIQILVELYERPGLSPSEIARRLSLSRSAVSRSLKLLDDEQLVKRSPRTGDRRSSSLKLSDTGRRRIRAFRVQLGDFFHQNASLVTSALHAFEVDLGPDTLSPQLDPLAVVQRMGEAGGPYVDDVVVALEGRGESDFVARSAVALLLHHRAMRPSQLGAILGLSSSSVTALLDRLERAGSLRRRYGHVAEDRRAVVVELTAQGRRASRIQLEVFGRHAEQLGHAMALSLPAPDRRRLRDHGRVIRTKRK